MNKGLLFLILALSGCSTITTESPKDLSQYAEVDQVIHGNTPEATIEGVAAYSGFSSKYFGGGLYQKGPGKLFLSPGTYVFRAGCYGALYIMTRYDEPVGFTPEFTATVAGGKKYLLRCEHKDSKSSLYLDEQ